MRKYLLNTLGVLIIFLACHLLAQAQATRTWVSGVGDDVNPCSRTAPCKTFAGAISKTAAGGEIDALDPGGFGGVTITKSITLDGQGTLASILASGATGVIINAGATDVVILRNLSINGAIGGARGINFIAGGALHVENCTIFNFTSSTPGLGLGIDFEPSGTSQLLVVNTSIRNNISGGVLVKPGALGSAKVSIENSQLDSNLFGIRAEDRSQVTVHNSSASSNTKNGFLSVANSTGTEMNLERCVSRNNGTNGVSSVGATSIIRLSYATVTDNPNGLTSQTSGQIISVLQGGSGTNFIAGNGVDGAPTGTITRQ